jgi:hypothetical protein
MILAEVSSHSASTKCWLVGRVNSALPQKSVPSPINISRLTNPTNRLANERSTRGNALGNGDS